jgi:hypothetical protein
MKLPCPPRYPVLLAAGFALGLVHADPGSQDAAATPAAKAPDFASLTAVQARKLGEIPADASRTSVTPDGRTIQTTGRKGSRQAVFVNGVVKETYDEIFDTCRAYGMDMPVPAFTADGSISLALCRKGKAIHLVANGVESAAFDEVVGIWAAPQGSGYVALGLRAKELVFHRDGKDLPAPELPRTWAVRRGVGEVPTPYLEIKTARYSPDGKSFVFLTSIEDQGAGKDRHVYVLDHKPLTPFDGPLSALQQEQGWLFADRGGDYAYVAKAAEGERVVTGKTAGPFQVAITSLKFSADGEHVVYTALRRLTDKEFEVAIPRNPGETDAAYSARFKATAADPRWSAGRVLRDGVELPWTSEPGEISGLAGVQPQGSYPQWTVIGPHGEVATAYTSGWDAARLKPRGVKVWVEGWTSMEYDAWHGTVFSRDGKRSLSVVSKAQRYYALIDGEETDGYANISLESARIGVEGEGYHFNAMTIDGKQLRVADGKPVGAAASEVEGLDGTASALLASRGREYGTPVDRTNIEFKGKVHEIPGEVVDTVISPDGARVACTFKPESEAYQGIETLAWVDGSAFPPLAGQDSATDPHFSPDGKHFAYTAAVDVKDHPDMPPGASGHRVHVRVIDGRPGPMASLDYKAPAQDDRLGSHFKEKMYPTTFGADGGVEYFARHLGGLYRVTFSGDDLRQMPDLASLARSQANAAKADAERMEKDARDTKEKQEAVAPFKILKVFEWTAEEFGNLVEGPDGRIYGGALTGRFKSGCLFSTDPEGADFRVEREFAEPGEDCLAIRTLLAAPDGMIYGGTGPNQHFGGSPATKASIFRFNPADRKFENLYVAPAGMPGTFADCDALEYPVFSGVSSDGTIYGSNLGRSLVEITFTFATRPEPVLEIIGDSSQNTWLVSKKDRQTLVKMGMSNDPERAGVGKLPVPAGDRLFATVAAGGRGRVGLLLSYDKSGKDRRVEYEFSQDSPEGGTPDARLIVGPDGMLYGTTTLGGARVNNSLNRNDPGALNRGSLFRFDPAKKECKPLVLFDATHGAVSFTLGPDGNLYFVAGKLYRVDPRRADSQPFTLTKEGYPKDAVDGLRFPDELHTFQEVPDKGIRSDYSVTSLVCTKAGDVVGLGHSNFQAPFVFRLRPPKAGE